MDSDLSIESHGNDEEKEEALYGEEKPKKRIRRGEDKREIR